ncbi:ATP-binding protein involved in chromosome partitioning [Thermosporothrix hazakensis]|jgi:ATP-binding protein involved in chromosome partitioning|uniref:Iron-sulfur cluster carrier protein n=2 Tax=Thermosporothrix TaxID=768650 RepID=A0A326U841_THEHA|nr:P-loop NTPase [Thermosporothrix hazakensis]PZW30475.1 ATP-binding protein involved in chromosome partitioning [Thermosporothrix hazakensis]BBH91190.1 hypothetical protein KTC_59410 [Thermosporothrix sp. COM3]GCE49335.1 hypothetical protein KTH_42040 [Thermosporothrix hazakensis]
MLGNQRERLPDVGSLLVVGSGKGGVGKSTVSVNLAVALARAGASVGLLDCDVYGPSVPMMLGVRKRAASSGFRAMLPLAEAKNLAPEKKIPPLTRYGVRVMSAGFFIGEEQAVAASSDMLGLLIRQLLYSVDWGRLDYVILDLPPGNGEPQQTLCREMALDGAILVTTPQDIARIDTAKALAMFQNADVPVLGVVQNMDGLLCPHCGERIEIYPHSKEVRTRLDQVPVLGSLPLDPMAARWSDEGVPVAISMAETPFGQAFCTLAREVLARQQTRNSSNE